MADKKDYTELMDDDEGMDVGIGADPIKGSFFLRVATEDFSYIEATLPDSSAKEALSIYKTIRDKYPAPANAQPKPSQNTQSSTTPSGDAPSCPKCQSEMNLRKGSNGDFHGCSQYKATGCKGTANV